MRQHLFEGWAIFLLQAIQVGESLEDAFESGRVMTRSGGGSFRLGGDGRQDGGRILQVL